MSSFKHIGLVARVSSDLIRESLRRVEKFLLARSVTILYETLSAQMAGGNGRPVRSLEQLGAECDLVIAVGGDGNILRAARAMAPFGVPILGINRGKLGFLADVSPEDIDARLGEVLSGDYSLEDHFLLEGFLEGETQASVAAQATGSHPALPSALNEVLIHSASMPKMIEMELYVDDVFVYNQQSDGLIVSSPTGSTAYSLSAGGPIMHPSLDAIVLVPMFPHSLTSRPLVVPGDSEVKIVISVDTEVKARVSFDSQVELQIEPGAAIIIRKKQERLTLVHPPGHSFYGACRSKLDWASKTVP